MLYEILHTRQIEADHRRRWFTDAEMDLYVWYDDTDEINGFQLCYGKPDDEHALTWRRGSGYRHTRVDDGETRGASMMAPILLTDGVFPQLEVAEAFRALSGEINSDIAAFVYDRIVEYPSS